MSIHGILREHRVDAVHDVDVVLAAPFHLDAALELLAVAGRAARVGEEHRPAVRGVDLELVEPVEAVHAGRPAVNAQHHRILLAALPADRLHEEAVDVPAVGALERHALDRRRAAAASTAPRSDASAASRCGRQIGDVEIVEMRRIVHEIRRDASSLLVDVDGAHRALAGRDLRGALRGEIDAEQVARPLDAGLEVQRPAAFRPAQCRRNQIEAVGRQPRRRRRCRRCQPDLRMRAFFGRRRGTRSSGRRATSAASCRGSS